MTTTPSYPTFRDNPDMRGRFDDDNTSNASLSGKREMYNKQEQRGTEDASPKLRPSSLPHVARMPTLQHQRSMSSPESDMYMQNMQNEDFSCPICFHTIKEAFLGRCGHSFCYICITGHLERKRDCPTCGCPLMRDQIYPNFLLNRILEKTPGSPASPFDGTVSPTTKHMRSAILASNLNADDINSMIVTLLNKKQRIESAEREAELDILSDFLSKVRAKKESKLMKLQQEIQCLNGDLYTIQEELKRIAQKQKRAVLFDDETIADNGSVLIGFPSSNDSAESDVIDSYQHKDDVDMNIAESPNSLNSSPALKPTIPETNEKLMSKKRRVLEHFEDLTDHYFSCRLTGGYQADDGLSDFCDSLSTFTHYSRFKLVNTLKYGDIFNTSSIVSSIEFDRDDEYFATAGVTKKIKIFDYGNIERLIVNATFGYSSIRDGQVGGRKPAELITHYPIKEMACRSKISCLSWNTYIKTQIASADYDGVITLWDALIGQPVSIFDEHEKRAWSVDFCRMDPTKLISGSDDTKVKLWSTNQKSSICTIEKKANICCVKFNPDISHYAALGSADHHIHYHDLRQPRDPVFIYRGHRKAVSYVKFMNSTQFVSASTDSSLRLWDANKQSCARTYTGHTNEKNFVGLTTSADWISCGSEDNAVYTYYKSLSQPVIKFNFGSIDMVTGEDTNDHDPSLFVSSVCWKKNTNTLLAANSQGTIKVLELE